MDLEEYDYEGARARLRLIGDDPYVAFNDLCAILGVTDRDALLADLNVDTVIDTRNQWGPLLLLPRESVGRFLELEEKYGYDNEDVRFFLSWFDTMGAWMRTMEAGTRTGGDGRGAASYPEWVVRALMDIVQDDHERLMRALETMLGHAKEEAS